MTTPFRDMEEMTRLHYEGERQKVSDLQAEEARLHQDLAALDARARGSAGLPAPDLAAPRGIGADLLWQGWLGRRRAALQTRLASVLARKGSALQNLRRAHGRWLAARDLLRQEEDALRRAQRQRQDAEMQKLIVVHNGRA